MNYYCTFTNTGLDLFAAATAGGAPIDFAQFAVGDGAGVDVQPTPDQKALVNQIWQGGVNRVYVHPNNADWVVIEAVIPAAAGGFDIREAGVFNAAGDMVAVGNYPLTVKPATGSGSEKDLYVRMILQITNAASVVQAIDPSLVMASKDYVDSRDWRESVRAATTGPIADLAAGAPAVLDGVALAQGDRLLVKDQANGAENGIYVVQTLGTGADGTWIRSQDADTALKVTADLTAAVEEGTVNADTVWMLTTNAPITLGTTALAFKQLITATELAAHTGRTDNPHAVTAAQAGADPAGSAATVQGNLDTHAADTGNPHGVTAAQAGADPSGSAATVQGNLDTHTADKTNPHGVTAAQAGADPSGSAQIVQTNLNTHAGNKANPHGVTAAQLGVPTTSQFVGGIPTRFKSAAFKWAANSILTFAHGLGAGVRNAYLFAQCTAANNGYVVGERVFNPEFADNTGGQGPVPLSVDGTNVYFATGDVPPKVPIKIAGTNADWMNTDTGSWDLYVCAEA